MFGNIARAPMLWKKRRKNAMIVSDEIMLTMINAEGTVTGVVLMMRMIMKRQAGTNIHAALTLAV